MESHLRFTNRLILMIRLIIICWRSSVKPIILKAINCFLIRWCIISLWVRASFTFFSLWFFSHLEMTGNQFRITTKNGETFLESRKFFFGVQHLSCPSTMRHKVWFSLQGCNTPKLVTLKCMISYSHSIFLALFVRDLKIDVVDVLSRALR